MNRRKNTIILGIESSCDDTSAAVIENGIRKSNVTAGQQVHQDYGGVVPELASRAHQQNIIPVVDQAIQRAGIQKDDIDAIAFTNGPGLLGSLLVGTSFAKAFALGQQIPMIDVNHMQAHILAHFIQNEEQSLQTPEFPFLCLTVSGGHTQIVKINDHLDMEVLGETMDDAAGEAFDKVAKIMGLPYPGGPLVDKYAKEGNPHAFKFSKPKVPDLTFSFSGLKTAFLYFIRDAVKANPNFIEENRSDICASIQRTIVEILMDKLEKAAAQTGIKQVALAGGVSANSGLRQALLDRKTSHQWEVYIPAFEYCTDNAAMIAITGHYKFLKGEFVDQSIAPKARLQL